MPSLPAHSYAKDRTKFPVIVPKAGPNAKAHGPDRAVEESAAPASSAPTASAAAPQVGSKRWWCDWPGQLGLCSLGVCGGGRGMMRGLTLDGGTSLVHAMRCVREVACRTARRRRSQHPRRRPPPSPPGLPLLRARRALTCCLPLLAVAALVRKRCFLEMSPSSSIPPLVFLSFSRSFSPRSLSLSSFPLFSLSFSPFPSLSSPATVLSRCSRCSCRKGPGNVCS
jgi:hypothetical protein